MNNSLGSVGAEKIQWPNPFSDFFKKYSWRKTNIVVITVSKKNYILFDNFSSSRISKQFAWNDEQWWFYF